MISNQLREEIKKKYNGRCAYSGTFLEEDWQVDHIIPKCLYEMGLAQGDPDNIENLVPTQKLINHYKRGLDIETFRREWLGKLHEKLKKLPRNPKTERSKKRKAYMLKIAHYFGVTEDKPFDGKFYFEKQSDNNIT